MMGCQKLITKKQKSLDLNNELTCFLNAFKRGEKVQYIIAPSMSFDRKLLQGIEGIEHYELRSFWEILRVKRKNTYVTFVSSEDVSEVLFNHFVEVFNLSSEEISRVSFVKCPRVKGELSLSKNLLMNQSCILDIKESLQTNNVILEAFVRTEDERLLAKALGVPTWHNHPQMDYFHTKSGNRFIVGDDAQMPVGFSDLYSRESVIKALIKLRNKSVCDSFMVKLNYGVSGQGNMKVTIDKESWDSLSDLDKKLAAEKSFINGDLFNKSLSLESFEQRIIEEGVVVEEFVKGRIIDSPSAQVMVTPERVELISTHKQILDSHGQKFIGGEYPCAHSYRSEVSEVAIQIGKKLKNLNVFGVTSIDYLISESNGEMKCFVIELNLRKGGTTHPFMLSNFALQNEGSFREGGLIDKNNVSYSYRSNDNFYPCKEFVSDTSDIINRAKRASILFSRKKSKGVIFHLLNGFSDSGKVGYTVIAPSKVEVENYESTLNQVLGAMYTENAQEVSG
tara:strand:+ start:1858 stop:3381 length:1524 start_codon:yes stop_codon:yes gene_type:complete